MSFGDKKVETQGVVDNINSILEQLVGKEYVIAYYNQDGIPSILPSEAIDIKDMVFLAELIKTAAISAMGIQEIE
jgi:uncharacterized protein YbaR (Trm112 family)